LLETISLIVWWGFFAAEGLLDESLALPFHFDDFQGFEGLIFNGNISAI
jgi:hypothetical protein